MFMIRRTDSKTTIACISVVIAIVNIPFSYAESTGNTNYIKQGQYGYGSINVEPVEGVEYVYGVDSRIIKNRETGVAVVGKRPNETEYRTASENKALWFIERRNKSNEQGEHSVNTTPRKTSASKRSSIPDVEWPKIIVTGNTICVPHHEQSETSEWRNALVCVDIEETKQ